MSAWVREVVWRVGLMCESVCGVRESVCVVRRECVCVWCEREVCACGCVCVACGRERVMRG